MGRPVATREYFPRNFRAAVRQRTRWVTGIALQSWEFDTALETARQLYWFWRDRKGLISNMIAPAMNILFVCGAATWTCAEATHHRWALARDMERFYPVYAIGLALLVLHASLRAVFSARIYGWRFACGVPLRIIVGNWINFFATTRAIWTYTATRIRRKPLHWAKTDHAYPDRAANLSERKRIGEVLTGSQWISAAILQSALSSRPPNRRLGEHLLLLGLITEENLYTALRDCQKITRTS